MTVNEFAKIEAVLEAKYAYNTGRPYRHGGKKL